MHISSRGFTRESWCKRVVNKLSQLLKIQDCPFDFISNTIQTQIYQQTRLQAQILFIFAYIVLHFHISYMCNLYIGIFFLFFLFYEIIHGNLMCTWEWYYIYLFYTIHVRSGRVIWAKGHWYYYQDSCDLVVLFGFAYKKKYELKSSSLIGRKFIDPLW